VNSIKDGATIRIGLEKCVVGDFGDQSEFYIQTYSLKINKKTKYVSKGGTEHYYGDFFSENIDKIAKIMNENNVKNYVIYNGETLDKFNRWEGCASVPHKVKTIFENTLCKYLK
jgi:hypothetical protein